METKPFISAIEQICEEKGISQKKVLETIEMALAAAYKKEHNRKGQNIKVVFDLKTGEIKASQVKLVVDKTMLKPENEEGEETIEEMEREDELTTEGEERKIRFNPEKHIMIEDAKKGSNSGDEIEFPLEVANDFGRIAAQTAKQVIIQRIREAERDAVYEEYKEKEGQIVSGVVQRVEKGNVFLDIGKTTGALFFEEQIPRENYRMGQRLKAYVTEVQKESHGPTIILSRAHPKMVGLLFELEVPEISSGTVEIKSIAREAGSRSKIAVASTEERVDPIGSMIGQKGTRVQAVINELGGEKIDIIEWSEDPVKFISQALSPAKVTSVKTDKEKNEAQISVPEDQLSLAIGIKGQNVRLAAKLTGWKIDIIAQEEKKKVIKKKVIKKEANSDKKEKVIKKKIKKETSSDEEKKKTIKKKSTSKKEPKDTK